MRETHSHVESYHSNLDQDLSAPSNRNQSANGPLSVDVDQWGAVAQSGSHHPGLEIHRVERRGNPALLGCVWQGCVEARPGNEMSAEPTGTVTVSAEENRCVVELVNGTGTCPMLFGSAGTKTITIAYPGDGFYQAGDPLAAGFDYPVIPFSQEAQLRTGLNQTYVYKADGTVGCIGKNCELDGQFTRLGVGDAYACGMHTNGGLLCESIDAAAPPLVFNNGPYFDLSVGKAHVCALKIDGQAACLGDQTHGQAAPPAGIFTSLSAGGGHTCALKENGEAVCWGEISDPPPGVFTRLISGEAHTCGLRPGGGMACWGDASNASMGQLNLPARQACSPKLQPAASKPAGLIRTVRLPAGRLMRLIALTPSLAGLWHWPLMLITFAAWARA